MNKEQKEPMRLIFWNVIHSDMRIKNTIGYDNTIEGEPEYAHAKFNKPEQIIDYFHKNISEVK